MKNNVYEVSIIPTEEGWKIQDEKEEKKWKKNQLKLK